MLRPGDTIDIWVVQKALGSGGMGSVYRCHNRDAPRILAAVKVLDTSLRRFPEAEARFVREAEILFQLDHPGIVKVRNVRTATDPSYLEMEFVDGESLEDRLARGPIPIEEALPLMQQVADAVRYLHERGVRHRDIKPANVLVQPNGKPKLVDFGLAVEAEVTRITAHGMSFGTVSYAPPEWITPEQIDPTAWDIYALGTVFYEMLTGLVAFPVSGEGSARQQAMQVIVAKQNHPPLDPGPAFHDDLRDLVSAMTQALPGKRLRDVRDVVDRLAAASPTLKQPGLAPTPSAPRPPARTEGRAGRTFVTTFGELPLTSRGMLAAIVALTAISGAAIALVGAGLYAVRDAPAAVQPPTLPAALPPVEPAPVVVPAVVPPPRPATEPAPAPEPPKPATPAPPAAPKRGGLVRGADLAAWLAEHPEVAGGIEVKGGKGPATGASAAIADAYCRDRGGLVAAVDHEPLLPVEPAFEIRRGDGGRFVVVQAVDGAQNVAPLERTKPISVAGFRCTK